MPLYSPRRPAGDVSKARTMSKEERTLGSHDGADRLPASRVLVPHGRHSCDLHASSKDIERVSKLQEKRVSCVSRACGRFSITNRLRDATSERAAAELEKRSRL